MWVRRLALTAALGTLALITLGGLVTNNDAGLACPDWPLCYGSPFPKLLGGILLEQGHRYLATLVGLCTVVVCVALLSRARQIGLAALLGAATTLILAAAIAGGHFKRTTGAFPPLLVALLLLGFCATAFVFLRTRGATRLSVLALALVVWQGLLGGATVIYLLPPTVLVLHLGTSMLFLLTMVILAQKLSGESPALAGASARLWLGLSASATYLQILLGAAVRHTGAGLICTDLPLCKGALWPLHVHPAVHLHMAHRAFALVVAALACTAAVKTLRAARGDGFIRALALSVPLLVALQIALGIATILTFKDLLPVTAHLLVAALLLAAQVALLAHAPGQARSLLLRPRPEAPRSGVAPEQGPFATARALEKEPA